jgi:hypothetical protein
MGMGPLWVLRITEKVSPPSSENLIEENMNSALKDLLCFITGISVSYTSTVAYVG